MGFGVALCLLLAAPAAAGDAPDREAQEEALWKLIVAPIDAGQGKDLLEASLGGPVEETAFPYEASFGEVFVAHFLRGRGWNGIVCQTGGRYTLQRFSIFRNLAGLPLPVTLGQNQEQVEPILGRGVSRDGTLVYEATTDLMKNFHRVTLLLEAGRVSVIEWVFEPDRVFCPHLDKLTGRIRQVPEATLQP